MEGKSVGTKKRYGAKRYGVRAVGAAVERLTRPIFGRRGFADASVITNWAAIVGEHLAAHTCPERISFEGDKRIDGTLQLRVANSALATELSHLEPQLLERINSYFGYRAVGRLRYLHGPIPERDSPEKPPPPALTPDQEHDLNQRLSPVTDDELATALQKLGRRLIAENASEKRRPQG